MNRMFFNSLCFCVLKVIAARGTPIHRNNSPYGENIFCSWSSIPNSVVKGWEPVEHWYSEGVNHSFGKEPATLRTGHFTQVVWRDSRELGVGMAKNRLVKNQSLFEMTH